MALFQRLSFKQQKLIPAAHMLMWLLNVLKSKQPKLLYSFVPTGILCKNLYFELSIYAAEQRIKRDVQIRVFITCKGYRMRKMECLPFRDEKVVTDHNFNDDHNSNDDRT